MSGKTAYLAGLSAEDQVARLYETHGYHLRARRWRGRGGEIDLIFEKSGEITFVEVKKSRDFDTAVSRVSLAQRARILQTGDEYLGLCPMVLATPCRYDLAALNQIGQVHIIANAFLE